MLYLCARGRKTLVVEGPDDILSPEGHMLSVIFYYQKGAKVQLTT